jgi:hypothetical protein
MSDFEDHFRDAAWIEFVRQSVSVERMAQMQLHLDKGCEPCRHAYTAWNQVWKTAVREANYEAPEQVVRSIKAVFRLRQKLPLLSRLTEWASLIFDSLHDPLPVGIRGGTAPARHLLHQSESFLIDLRLADEGATCASLVGQVLPKQTTQGSTAGTGIALTQGEVLITQTVANAIGEFQMEFEYLDGLILYLQIPNSVTIGVALPRADESRAED